MQLLPEEFVSVEIREIGGSFRMLVDFWERNFCIMISGCWQADSAGFGRNLPGT